MSYASTKEKEFLNEMRDCCEMMESFRSKAKRIATNYFSNGYHSGGSNAIADQADGTYEGLTATQIASVVTSLTGFETWFDAGHDENVATMASTPTKTWRR